MTRSIEINAVAALRAGLNNDWDEAKRMLEPHSDDFDELIWLADVFHSLEGFADELSTHHYKKSTTEAGGTS